MKRFLVGLAAALIASAALADVKISDLPAGTTLAGTEPIPAVQAGATVKTTPAAILTYTKAQLVSADIRGLWTGTCNATTFLRGDGACAQVSLTTTVSGVLPVINGGTGQGSLATDNLFTGNGTGAMISQVLPSCSGATNALAYNTTTHAFVCNTIASGGTPGGATTNVQFNNSGAFGGDADFLFDAVQNIVTLGSAATPGLLTAPAGAVTMTVRGGTGSSSAGGGLTLAGGTGTTTNGGGAVAVNGGQGGPTSGAGNGVTVTGGTGGAPNGNSGFVELVAGSPSGTGTIGDIRFSMPSTATQAGQLLFRDTSGDNLLTLARSPATASYTAINLTAANQKGVSAGLSFGIAGGTSSTAPGALNLNGGACTGSTCVGGAVNIASSAGVGVNQAGGVVSITSGASTGTANGNNINITAGAGGTSIAGNVTITGGATSGAGVTGGTSQIIGGTAGSNANGGGAFVQGGTGQGTGQGGDARVTGGTAGATGSGGTVKLTGGTPTDGVGGDIQITASNGVGTNRNGGSVIVTTGAATGSGTAGAFTVNGNPVSTTSSGSFSAVFSTGFTTTPSLNFNWTKAGNVCVMRMTSNLTGTSNTTTATTSANPVPAACRSVSFAPIFITSMVDNGASRPGCITFELNGNVTLNLYSSTAGTCDIPFTATGTKGTQAATLGPNQFTIATN